jgi:hypothetical protein
MENLIVLGLAVLIATAAFAWLVGGLVNAISWPVARLGSVAHDMARRPTGDEQSVWLFVLLMGVTRVAISILASLWCAAALSAVLLPSMLIVEELRDSLFGLVLILLLMRLVAIFFAAYLLGGSVRAVLKTLRS